MYTRLWHQSHNFKQFLAHLNYHSKGSRRIRTDLNGILRANDDLSSLTDCAWKLKRCRRIYWHHKTRESIADYRKTHVKNRNSTCSFYPWNAIFKIDFYHKLCTQSKFDSLIQFQVGFLFLHTREKKTTCHVCWCQQTPCMFSVVIHFLKPNHSYRITSSFKVFPMEYECYRYYLREWKTCQIHEHVFHCWNF